MQYSINHNSPMRSISSRLNVIFFNNVKNITVLLSVFAAMFFAASASAITEPQAGSFAYDIYDIIVLKVLKGPIGFVGGLAAIVVGAVQLTKSWILAIVGVLSGTVIIKADTITSSLGMVVSAM